METDYYNWLFVFLRVSAFLLVLRFSRWQIFR